MLEPADPAASGVAGRDQLYFVAETKPSGGLLDDARRGREQGKIDWGRAHFAALAAAAGDNANPAEFIVASSAGKLRRQGEGGNPFEDVSLGQPSPEGGC